MEKFGTIQTKIGNFCTYQTTLYGVIFDKEELVVASVKRTRHGPKLISYERTPLEPSSLGLLQKEHPTTTYIGTTLPSSLTLMRPFILPLLSQSEIPPAITDLLEQTQATALENSSFVYEINGKDHENLSLCVFSSRNHDIEQTISRFNSYNLDPHIIIPQAKALAEYIKHFQLSSWQLVIHIEITDITIILLHNYAIIESRIVPGSSVNFATVEDSATALKEILQKLLEISNSYKERFDLANDVTLSVTGKASQYPLTARLIEEYINVPLSGLHHNKDCEDTLGCASAIGTAFCCDPSTAHITQLNYRTHEFAHKNPLVHWKRPLLSLALASISICGILIWYGISSYQSIRMQMEEQRQRLYTLTHIQNDSSSSNDPEAIVLQSTALLQEIEKQSLFPLEPKIPKLNEILSALSMQIAEVARTIDDSSPLEIQTLRYSLVNYPTKKNLKEHYQLLVTLEFSTPSVALARAFHEQICTNCSFVQKPGEVSWAPGAEKYKIAFYAKDSTLYPPLNI
jgi:hypothetical protein